MRLRALQRRAVSSIAHWRQMCSWLTVACSRIGQNKTYVFVFNFKAGPAQQIILNRAGAANVE